MEKDRGIRTYVQLSVKGGVARGSMVEDVSKPLDSMVSTGSL